MEQNSSKSLTAFGMNMLLRIPEALLAILVAALIVFVTGSVIARYAINIGVPWSDEASELLFVWIVLLGFAVGLRHRANVGVEMATDRMSQTWQYRFLILQDLVILVFSIIFTWEAKVTMRFAMMQRFPGMQISIGWLYAAALAAGVLMIAYALANLWDTVRNKSHQHDALAESAIQRSE